jgi:hypothetical protein
VLSGFFEASDIGVSQAGETTKEKGVPNLCEPITGKFFMCHQVQLSSGKDRFVNLLEFAFEVQIWIKVHPAIAQADVDDFAKHFHVLHHSIVPHLTN